MGPVSAIMYEWDVPPEREQEFIDGCARGTRSIHQHCGSSGSRLHQAEDGRWVAYARWPSLDAHDRCTLDFVPELELMTESIAGPPRIMHRLRIVHDLLDEPRTT